MSIRPVAETEPFVTNSSVPRARRDVSYTTRLHEMSIINLYFASRGIRLFPFVGMAKKKSADSINLNALGNVRKKTVEISGNVFFPPFRFIIGGKNKYYLNKTWSDVCIDIYVQRNVNFLKIIVSPLILSSR